MKILIFLQMFVLCLTEECHWVWRNSSLSRLSTCGDNCYLTRERLKTDGKPCDHGILLEDISNCAVPPNQCPGSNFPVIETNSPCSGPCDRGIERVTLQCQAKPWCRSFQNRYCTHAASCVGEWTTWGEYSKCNSTTNGYKKRLRNCINRETNRMTSYCRESRGKREQTQVMPCSSCDAIFQPRRLPSPSDSSAICRCHCSTIHDVIKPEKLYKQCDVYSMKHNATCNSQHGYVVSCEGDLSDQNCAPADNSLFCNNLLDWSGWGNWTKHDGGNGEWRHRHRWCASPLYQFSDSQPCHLPVRIDKQCRTADIGLFFEKWIIIAIAISSALLILLSIIICCLWKNKRSKNQTNQNGIEMTKLPETDTKTSSNQKLAAPESNGATTNSSSQIGHLYIVKRLSRVSEHMYEVIIGKGSLSSPIRKTSTIYQTSARKNSPVHRALIHKSSKEVLDDGKLEANKSNQNEPKPDRLDVKQAKPGEIRGKPPRISVTVTDPEGIQVGKNVYKPKLTRNQKRVSKAAAGRTRWSRMPTPEPASRSQFFEPNLEVKQPTARPRVTSVKYSAPSAGESKSLNPPVTSPHQYDEVPIEKYYIKSANNSLSMDADRASLWSQSTFDGDDEVMSNTYVFSPTRTSSKFHSRKEVKTVEKPLYSTPHSLLAKNLGITSLKSHNSPTPEQHLLLPEQKNECNYMDMTAYEDDQSNLLEKEFGARLVEPKHTNGSTGSNQALHILPHRKNSPKYLNPNLDLPTDSMGYSQLDPCHPTFMASV